MQLGPLLGRGARAEVYGVGYDRAIKLYGPDTPRATVETEARKSEAVVRSGIPAPAVFGVVEHDGRFGILVERVPGPSLGALLLSDSEPVEEGARLLAELHVRVHSVTLPELPTPNLRTDLMGATRAASALCGSVREDVCSVLRALPLSGEVRLCHGDFHPMNVMMSPDGPRIIDWVDAINAPPVVDVARTALLLQLAVHQFADIPGSHSLLNAFRGAYLEHYVRQHPLDLAEVRAWQLPLAVARTHERIELESQLLPGIVRGLLDDNRGGTVKA